MAESTDQQNWTQLSSGVDSYTPLAADIGAYIRATVTCEDYHGPNKTASGVTSFPVRPTVTGVEPAFANENIKLVVLAELLISGYEILRGLAIDSGTGSVTVTDPVALQVGSHDTFAFAVLAVDPDGNTGKMSVSVKINSAPEITNKTAGGAISVAENTTGTLYTYTYTATDGDTITWSVTGDDDATFGITDGELTLAGTNTLDFEAKSSHSFTVEASDGSTSDTVAVTLTVTDGDEMGSVTFDSASPQVGAALTATLTDQDGGVTGATWQWATSADGSTAWSDISAATSSSCTPVAGDVGKYLRATASYTDGHGANKTANAVAAVSGRPGAPTDLRLIPQALDEPYAQLDFVHPSSHGGKTITHYQVDYSETGPTEPTIPPLDGLPEFWDGYRSTLASVNITTPPLTNDNVFKVRMRPRNAWVVADEECTAAGTGPWSYTFR